MTEYTTPEAVLKLGETDPQYAELRKDRPGMELAWEDVHKLREQVGGFTAGLEVPTPASTISIAMRDGCQNEALVYKPSTAPASGSALIVLAFGGGFVGGANAHMAPRANQLSTTFGATVVCITYRVAPEHPFPVAAQDAWDSLSWIAANAASLGADPSAGFIVGGVSAGANLAAVVAQKAVDTVLSPALTGVWLSVPVILDEAIVPVAYKDVYLAREQNRYADILDARGIFHLMKYYNPDVHSPDWSPFNSPNAHKDMPPVYFQVDGQDPLRDDGLIYERVLRSHGVKTKIDVYPGVPHGHSGGFAELKLGQKADEDTIKGVEWLLYGTST
ncbi:hypothetical protein FH972_026619 [Carpinus fangiana]|uniref:Alpha/beta hydrolase fold-3 domain-containing protein n=1 Tax=Carpinus fangiana TaxID=176857 RepID=A0A5N6L4Z2_9ROSI|nr:hypothetical protein FH972_026619 [Carpinus fangiana]